MSEEEAHAPIAPLKSYVEGLGIIGGVVLTCACLGGGYALLNNGLNTDLVWRYAKGGAFAGFVISLIGGLEMAAGLLFDKGPWQNKLSRSAGYLTVWAGCLYGALNLI